MKFPQSFIDEIKQHADIVVVIQDYVSLKKTGATYKGLCPFHGERTPSFHVNRDKGFFHCFGCGVGGDVFKFLELHEKVGFQDAVRQLAQRFGLTVPELEQSDVQKAGAAERETLLKIHEVAAAWFRQQLTTAAAARIRKQVSDRGVSEATAETMGLGFAPPARDALKRALIERGFSQPLLLRSGLLVQRDDGTTIDRFRNRLMIPICRDTGAVIGFGGRAVDPDQQPKYLNSPETPIYSKGRTLYGLQLSKALMRQSKFAVLVEGYFDFGQVFQAGFPAVASCGTALTPHQAQQLRRFTDRVVLSFDPDDAGQGAAAKSCELLVAEGFDVNVATLPRGTDPDTFVRQYGRDGYGKQLKQSKPYLEYLLERVASGYDLNSADGKVRFVDEMVGIAERVTDRTRQELLVKEIASKAGVSEDLLWTRVRKTATPRANNLSNSQLAGLGEVTKAEKGLIWLLIHRPEDAVGALVALEDADIEALSSTSVLDLARKLNEDRGFSPSVLLERLTLGEAQLVTAIASESEAHVHEAAECTRILKRRRYERERTTVQRAIDRLQQRGADGDGQLEQLLMQKYDLIQRINGLS